MNIARRAAAADPGRIPASRAPGTWLWVLVALCLIAVVLLGILYVFGKTSVTVVPHAQPVTFDQTMQYTAYPASGAASGTLPYTITSEDIQDTENLEATGTAHKEQKASGEIAVMNNYSASPVKLIKNTRFQTASGLIFRAPASISIPGKQGDTPGKVTITVVADAPGAEYNIAALTRLSLPGLAQNAPMYKSISAETIASTTGGFSGDMPSVAESALAAAISDLRARLSTKARAFAAAEKGGIILDPVITFTDGVPTSGQNGAAVVTEVAHVTVPAIAPEALAGTIARAVTANASAIGYSLIPGKGFSAALVGTPALGTDPIAFSLSGAADLVANIDARALAGALAGRDSTAFQSIVSNFPGIDSAHARIEPFWENSFPKNPSEIHVIVQSPAPLPGN